MRLGIDFGTCYSSAALLLDNTLKPIKEPLKHVYSFPSSVFLTPEGEMLVGFAAENRRLKDIQRYKNEFKRVLGKPEPLFLGDRQLQPEELVTEVIARLKTEADKVVTGRGEQSLSQAILTVPATYLSNKRQLMVRACDHAGFSQVQLLEEPVAAAIYYSNTAKIAEGDIILVYDLGGGVKSVAFSLDGQILAGGTTKNAIALWQVSTGRHICNLMGHTSNVNSIAFYPEGTTLASGSDDKTIKLWQRE